MAQLVAAANLTEMIGQLTNAAPAIERLGVPAYNWLSDDEHGVRGWESTYFPDGYRNRLRRAIDVDHFANFRISRTAFYTVACTVKSKPCICWCNDVFEILDGYMTVFLFC